MAPLRFHDHRLTAVIVASVATHAALVLGSSPGRLGASSSHAVPISARLIAFSRSVDRPGPAATAATSAAEVAKTDGTPVQRPGAPAPTPLEVPASIARSESATKPASSRPTVSPPSTGSAVAAAASASPMPEVGRSAEKAAAADANAAFDAYKSAGLDPPPRPLGDIEPEYPAAAGLQEGVVALRLLINEAGTVDRVVVLRSTPAGFFEDSASRAFAAAKFAPGRFLGIPVKSQITVEVEFTPVNRGSVGGRTY
jgi:protein TonB